MFLKKSFLRLRIMLSIILALLVVKGFAPVVFLAETPSLNKQIGQDFAMIPYKVAAYVSNPLSTADAENQIETNRIASSSMQPSHDLNYTPVSTSVFASIDPQDNQKYVKLVKGTMVDIYDVRLSDGRLLKVYAPRQ